MLFLGDIIEDIAPYVGDSGVCPETGRAKLLKELNQARRLLWNRGDWKGIVEYGCLNTTDCYAALPWHLQQIRKAWYGKYPIEVRNQWYEGLSFAGIQNCCNSCCDKQIVDTGETKPIAKPWPEGWLIQVDPIQKEEDGDTISFYVKDRGGVRSTQVFDLNNPRLGDEAVYDILGVTKGETNGPIRIWAVNGSEKQLMAMYHPDQTNPTFTMYKVTFGTGEGDRTQILVKAKKRFWKVDDDTDPLGIDNITALQLALQAKSAQARNNLDEYAAFLAAAEENLEEDIEEMSTNPFEPIDLLIEGAVPNLVSARYGRT